MALYRCGGTSTEVPVPTPVPTATNVYVKTVRSSSNDRAGVSTVLNITPSEYSGLDVYLFVTIGYVGGIPNLGNIGSGAPANVSISGATTEDMTGSLLSAKLFKLTNLSSNITVNSGDIYSSAAVNPVMSVVLFASKSNPN